MQFSRYILTVLSVITYTNCFVYLITGKTSYRNSTALLIGLARNPLCSVFLARIYMNFSNVSSGSASVSSFLNLAATCSPTPLPVQYHRPLGS